MGAYEDEALRLKGITDGVEVCVGRVCTAAELAETEVQNLQAQGVTYAQLIAAANTSFNNVDDTSLINQLIIADRYVNKREVIMYVDPNYTGVYGRTTGYYRTVTDAVNAAVDGSVNKIHLRAGTDHYLGGENPQMGDPTVKTRTFYLDTTLSFVSWLGTANFYLPYYVHTNGYQYSAYRLSTPSGVGTKCRITLYGLNTHTIGTSASNLPYHSFMYGGFSSSWELMVRGGSLTIDANTNLIATYVTSVFLGISLQYCSFNGDGDLVIPYGHGTITHFHHNSLSRPAGSTNFIFSHAKTDRSNHVLAAEPSFYARNNN